MPYTGGKIATVRYFFNRSFAGKYRSYPVNPSLGSLVSQPVPFTLSLFLGVRSYVLPRSVRVPLTPSYVGLRRPTEYFSQSLARKPYFLLRKRGRPRATGFRRTLTLEGREGPSRGTSKRTRRVPPSVSTSHVWLPVRRWFRTYGDLLRRYRPPPSDSLVRPLCLPGPSPPPPLPVHPPYRVPGDCPLVYPRSLVKGRDRSPEQRVLRRFETTVPSLTVF